MEEANNKVNLRLGNENMRYWIKGNDLSKLLYSPKPQAPKNIPICPSYYYVYVMVPEQYDGTLPKLNEYSMK